MILIFSMKKWLSLQIMKHTYLEITEIARVTHFLLFLILPITIYSI